MKTDDFEEQLQQQPWRKVPPQWREEILAQARQTARRSPPEHEFEGLRGIIAFWREWLWPSPKAWGALACIWALLAIANFGISELRPINPPSSGATSELSPEKILALKEQRLLRAELLSNNSTTSPAPAPKPRTKAEGPFSHA